MERGLNLVYLMAIIPIMNTNPVFTSMSPWMDLTGTYVRGNRFPRWPTSGLGLSLVL